MKKIKFNKIYLLLTQLILLSLLLTACTTVSRNITGSVFPKTKTINTEVDAYLDENQNYTDDLSNSADLPDTTVQNIDTSSIPDFNGTDYYIMINNNIPYFTKNDMTTTAFEHYSELDNLGRCGVAYANICKELMPTEERGNIGMIKPSGWQTVKYDFVEGKYLYNRCHLIGYQLAGENANERNLITGTRYFNTPIMLKFEDMVADYVKNTDHHVLYRVTPVFRNNNLVAAGVLIEAMSVEDSGKGILFNVFCYNAQPGVIIDYATGSSSLSGEAVSVDSESLYDLQNTEETILNPVPESSSVSSGITYVCNHNSMKFHLPTCESVQHISIKNRIDVSWTRDECISNGYSPCKACNP